METHSFKQVCKDQVIPRLIIMRNKETQRLKSLLKKSTFRSLLGLDNSHAVAQSKQRLLEIHQSILEYKKYIKSE